MRALPLIALTDAMLVSSTAPEPAVGETVWTAGATFGQGDQAIVGAPSATVTITMASPAVVSWAGNGLPNGTPVVLTTTGALPAGLVAGARYFVVNRTDGAFQLSATLNGAPIVATGSQSGTHTATASIHRKYQSLKASNTGKPPAIDDGTNWFDVGPTNRWACFDIKTNMGTEAASPLTIVIQPGVRIDTVGLIGLVATGVSIVLSVGGVVKYSKTINLLERNTTGWYAYYFGRFRYRRDMALTDIPPFSGTQITITITNTQGNAKIRNIAFGLSTYIGKTLHSAESDALNFSKIDRDEYGTATLQPRRSVPRSNQNVRFAKDDLPSLLDLRDDLNAIPALWLGIDDQESGYFPALLMLGIYKKFTFNLDQPNSGLAALELEAI